MSDWLKKSHVCWPCIAFGLLVLAGMTIVVLWLFW